MNRHLTLQQYRSIDLTLFAVMLAIFEFLITRFAAGSVYAVSLAGAITTIVYMRWGWWGGIHAALSGALFCLYFNLSAPAGVPLVGARDYLIYIVGNLFSLLAVPALLKLGKEKVRQHVFLSLGLALGVVLLMQGGRMLVALVLGKVPQDLIYTYFLYDALSILFALVVTWIVRRLDGVFEDQKHYLLRLQEERERNNTEQ